MESSNEITQLLVAWSAGNKAALDKLLPLVYNELRHLAASYLRRERPDHTLQATELVHEAYFRLINREQMNGHNRAQFFGMAAQIMRNILVDHARGHLAEKRGGHHQKLSLDEALDTAQEKSVDLVALDDALKSLAALDAQQSRIIELRYFGGLTIEETATVLGLSPAAVFREWTFARVWLLRQLSKK
jgi:RNA polymerase sigma factor (TIGR02999 family)